MKCRKLVAFLCVFALMFTALSAGLGTVSAAADPELAAQYAAIRGINYSSVYSQSWAPEALMPERYREDLTRKDLENVVKMGFNSIRLWPRTINYFTDAIAAEIDGNMDVYRSILSICREYNLTAMVILFMEIPASYGDDTSASAILDGYAQLAEEFDDVIIGFEIANEPDLAVDSLNPSSVLTYLGNSSWDGRKPFVKWATDYFRAAEGTKPLSCGFMTAPLFDHFDQDNYEIANVHNYEPVLSDFGQVFTNIKSRDNGRLGYARPLVTTELGQPGGLAQPLSDTMKYCEDNGIGYYIWEYANGYWGDMQGIFDNAGVQRIATLPYSAIENFKQTFPVTATAFDATNGGTGLYQGIVTNTKNNLTTGNAASLSERFVNGTRSLLGYYTKNFSDIIGLPAANTSSLSDIDFNYHYAIYRAASASLPYIRANGAYAANNALGGSESVSYWDGGSTGTSPVPLYYRPKFYAGMGKHDSTAVLLQNESRLLPVRELASSTYTLSADLKPGFDSEAAISVLAEKNDAQVRTRGFRVSVSANVSTAGQEIPAIYAAPYLLKLTEVYDWQGLNTIASVPLTASDFDTNGYINAAVTADYGSASSVISVYINGEGSPRLTQTVTVDSPSLQKYAGFDCFYWQSAYVDNMKLSQGGTVLFSDDFENGKSYERLVYNPQTNAQLKSDVQDIITAEKTLLNLPADGGSAPAIISASFDSKSALNVTFTDNYQGEAAYELQALVNTSFVPVWRSLPDETTIKVPQSNQGTKYRLVVVKTDDTYGPSVNISLPLALLAQYNFNDANDLGKDTSGNQNHLTKRGSGTLTQTGGAFGKGLYLNGAFLEYQNPADDFSDGLEAMTLSFWAKRNAGTSGGRIVGNGYLGSLQGFTTIMNINGANTEYFTPTGGHSSNGSAADTWWSTFYGTNAAQAQSWHHYTLTVDNETKYLRFYIDGKEVKNLYLAGGFELSNPNLVFAIGAASNGLGWFDELFNGYVDDVNLFGGIATQAQINNLLSNSSLGDFNADIEPIAKYTFDDNLLADSSGRGNDLHKVGSGSYTQVAGRLGNAVHFDGTAVMAATGGTGTLDFTDGLSNMTLSYWLKRDNAQSFQGGRAVSSGYWGGVGGFTTFHTIDGANAYTGAPMVGIGNNGATEGGDWGTGDTWGRSEYILPAQRAAEWHQYTMTVDNRTNTVKLYMDGVLKHSYTNTNGFSFLHAWESFTIGAVSDGAAWIGEPIVASMDEVIMYSDVLSPKQVSNLYNNGTAQDVKQDIQPFASYTFEDNANLGKDTANSNHLTATGTVTQVTGVNGGHAASFNGSSSLAATAAVGVSDFSDNLRNMTVGFWAKSAAVAGGGRVVGNGYFGGNGGYSFIMAGNTDLERTEYMTPVVGYNATGAVTGDGWAGSPGDTWWSSWSMKPLSYITDWHYYTFTVSNDSKEINFYVDGILNKTTACEFGFQLTNLDFAFAIGGLNGEMFNGSVDDMKLYSDALTAQQVANLYALGDTVSHAAAPAVSDPDMVKTVYSDVSTVSVSAAATGTLSYQWYESGVLIPGAVYASLVTTNAAVGTHTFTCTVTNTDGTVNGNQKASATVTAALTVYARGDADTNGTLNAFDLVEIKLILLGLNKTPDALTLSAANMDKKDGVTLVDLVLVKKAIVEQDI